MNSKNLILCIACLSLVGGCDMSSENAGELVAQIQSTAISVGQNVEFRLDNQTDAIIKFRSCCADVGFYVEIREDGRWHRIGSQKLECDQDPSGVTIACESMPLSLAPGESHIGDASIVRSGVYRLSIPFEWQTINEGDGLIITDEFTVK